MCFFSKIFPSYTCFLFVSFEAVVLHLSHHGTTGRRPTLTYVSLYAVTSLAS